MPQVHALRLALAIALAAASGVLAQAQLSVYVRVVEAGVEGVDSDDVPDDVDDAGAIGDADELTWWLRSGLADQNRRGNADTLVLQRDGGVEGDPPVARFSPRDVRVLAQTAPTDGPGLPAGAADGIGGHLAARRYGSPATDPAQLTFFAWLKGYEDDADLGAEPDYDADEDDEFEEVRSVDYSLAGFPKDEWAPLGEDLTVVTEGGRYGLRLEVYITDYRASDFTAARRPLGGEEPVAGDRFCAGADDIALASVFEEPSEPYDGVSWELWSTVNGEPSTRYSLSPRFPQIQAPRHSGGPGPDTLTLTLYTVTRFGFFFPSFYYSGPSDTVTVYVEAPAVPESAVTARIPGIGCTNYDGAPLEVRLAAGYDALDYDFAVTDVQVYDTGLSADYYTAGERTADGFRFDVAPDYYESVVVLPRDGSCATVVFGDPESFYEPEYELRWTDVTVVDGTDAEPLGNLSGAAAARATQPWYDSLYPPFRHEYLDAATGEWTVLAEASPSLALGTDVPAGGPYGLRVTDALGCRLDTAGLSVGGPAAGPSVTAVDVSETCALTGGLAAVRVEAEYPGSVYTELRLAGRTAAGEAYDDRLADGEDTFRDVPPGRYAVGVEDVPNAETYWRPDSVDVAALAPERTLALDLFVSPVCAPPGFEVTVGIRDGAGLDAPRYALDAGAYGTARTFAIDAAGTYTFRARDEFACAFGDTAVALDPRRLQVAAPSVTDADCEGGATGSAAFGAPPHGLFAEYSLDGVDYRSDSVFVGLPAGAYTGYRRIDERCVSTVDFVVGGGARLLDSLGATPVRCSGERDGTLTAYPSAAAPALEYALDGETFTALRTYAGLAAGTYTVTAREVGGTCTQSLSVEVTAPAAPLEARFDVEVAPTCGQANGYLVASATGGTPPYTYRWGTGATGALLDPAAGGPNTVTATDARGCTDTYDAIVPPSQAQAIRLAGATDNACFGESRGTATLAADLPSVYTLRDSAGATVVTSDDGVFGGLAAGRYTAIATAVDEGCADSLQLRIEQPAELFAGLAFRRDPGCGPDAGGRLTLSASGGTGTAYAYSLDALESTQPGADFSDLPAGEYLPAVRDEAGCTVFLDPVTLVTPAALTLGFEVIQGARCGAADGVAEVYPSGGTEPYAYVWGGGATTQRATGLPAGRATVTVTDAAGCSLGGNVDVPGPQALVLTVAEVTAARCGEANGAARVSANRPAGTVTFDWGPDVRADGPAAFDLRAGTYAVTATDDEGCTAALVVEIGGDGALDVSYVSTDASCAPGTDGAIVAVGEAPPGTTFRLAGVTDVQTDGTFGGLPPGDYTVVAETPGGCLDEDLVTVGRTGLPTVGDVVVEAPTCAAPAGGRIAVIAAGADLAYSFDGGETFGADSARSGLGPGRYVVVVRGAGACLSDPREVVLPAPTDAPVVTGVAATPPTCADPDGGRLEVEADGVDLRYALDGGPFQGSPTFVGLGAGSYEVVVRSGEAEGCVTATDPVTLAGPTSVPEVAGATAAPTSCRGAADGVVVVGEVSGGRPPYRYAIAGGDYRDDGGTFAGVPAGDYEVVVEDANGCTAVTAVRVGSGPELGLRVLRRDNPACGEANGRIEVGTATGEARYRWLDGEAGGPVREGLAAGRYTVVAETAAGCTDTLVTDLVDRGAPRLSVEEVGAATCGRADGRVRLAAVGGQAPYAYVVGDERSDDGTVAGLGPGAYTARVTDAAGCVATVGFEVGAVGAIGLAATDTAVCGEARVEVRAIVLAGAAVRYEWSNGDRGATTRLRTGETATVTAYSAEGCEASATAAVRDGRPEGEPTVAYAPACPGEATGARATVTGFGERDSLYVFDGVRQASPTFADVAPGTYAFGVVVRGGCVAEAEATLAGLPALRLSASDTTYANCAPVVTLAGGGGAGGPYRFSADGTAFDTASVFALAGPAAFYLEDARGCRLGPVTVDVPAPRGPDVTASVDYGACGETEATVTLVSDAADVGYVWSDGFAGARREGLRAGLYDVTATSGEGCVATVEIRVEAVAPLRAIATEVTGVRDCRAPSGRAAVAVRGGIGPYAYAWSHDATLADSTAAGLPAGEYAVVVTDARGCRDTLAVSVPGEAGIRLGVAAQTPVTCAGLDDGAVALSLSGPDTTGVRVRWSDGSGARTRAGLAAGVYTVTAADERGCVDTLRVSVGDDRLRVAEAVVTEAGCDSVGAIDLAIAGGVGAYRVRWGDGLGGRARTGLAAGAYDVTVGDAGGCAVDTVVIVAGDTAVVLPDDAIAICPGEVRAYGVPYAPDAVTWRDETGFELAADSVLLVDRGGAFSYEVSGLGACGGRGTLEVTQADDALFAHFLLATAAVVGVEVVAVETSVPAPDSVRWDVRGPGPATALASDRNEYRWRFDAVGTYTLTLEARRGACVTAATKTLTVVADSTQLPAAAPSFGELVSLAVAPNPTTGPFTVEVAFTAPRPISVRVYDLAGGLVAEEVSPASPTHAVGVDIGGELAGQYFAVVTTGAGSYVQGLVLVD